MSTRCNIIIKDGKQKLYFYRHSDGYPSGVSETLNKFLDGIKTGKIRDNLSQAAGWLIIIGRDEATVDGVNKWTGYEWKVGSYEPTDGIHDDIEYLYEIDLEKKTLKGWNYNGKKAGRVTFEQQKLAA